MNAAEAMPPARLSADTTAISACTSWPRPASHAKSRLLAALNTAPSMSTRITPSRIDNTPPTNAPTSVITTPNTLLTLATSSLVKPMST